MPFVDLPSDGEILWRLRPRLCHSPDVADEREEFGSGRRLTRRRFLGNLGMAGGALAGIRLSPLAPLAERLSARLAGSDRQFVLEGGQYTSFAGYEGVREGNVHFAGEHTSYEFQGYMEGGRPERGAVRVRDPIRPSS